MFQRPFQYCLQFFEPRELYISEKRLQEAWKKHLWKKARKSSEGQRIQVLSPGRHNHNEGPDFLDAQVFIGKRLFCGDIEVHRHAGDWYAHGHHRDARYGECILHVVFHPAEKDMKVRDKRGREIPLCYVALEEVLALVPDETCILFSADPECYFALLKEQGRRRFNQKIRYFYRQHVRFPWDVMLYWGLFKACGYRYNEDNMIRLFMIFPWEDYICGLLPESEIAGRLRDLAGFDMQERTADTIHWTYAGTRPCHYPEKRVLWLSAVLKKYYGREVSEQLYQATKNCSKINEALTDFFDVDDEMKICTSEGTAGPGPGIRKEMILNTILPLMEAMRLDKKEPESVCRKLQEYVNTATLPQSYGRVAKFHTEHGIAPKDKRRRNWLASQGVLYVQDHFCSQELQHCCPVCALAERL